MFDSCFYSSASCVLPFSLPYSHVSPSLLRSSFPYLSILLLFLFVPPLFLFTFFHSLFSFSPLSFTASYLYLLTSFSLVSSFVSSCYFNSTLVLFFPSFKFFVFYVVLLPCYSELCFRSSKGWNPRIRSKLRDQMSQIVRHVFRAEARYMHDYCGRLQIEHERERICLLLLSFISLRFPARFLLLSVIS